MPIWLLVALNAGWVAVAVLIRRFRHADLRDALRVARDLEMDARFAALKEKAGRTFREAMLALSMERMALSGHPMPVVAAPSSPQTPALVDVEYLPAPASGHRYSWPAVDRKSTVVLGDAGQASGLRQFVRNVSEADGGEKPGRHRFVDPLSDDTRQFDAREVLDAVVVEAS